MTKFEIGKEYSMRSCCDYDCVWTYIVIDRTAKTITITDGNETKTCRVNKMATEISGQESIFPLGQYSMAPVLRA